MLRKTLAKLAERKQESLRLYDPLPVAREFHMSPASERILRGSNRAGKTTPAAVELAWAITGQHPYLTYPKVMKCYVVGKDERQIGEVLWPKLSEPGAFNIFFDRKSHKWRTHRPWNKEDSLPKNSKLIKPAPPLLPPRFIKSITYYKKKANVPKIVRLVNGSKILFLTSAGNPPQGSQIHFCLAGWSEIYDPVLGAKRRIDEIDGPFHVRGFDSATGLIGTYKASRPFVKGYGALCRVTLSNGRELFTTREHLVMRPDRSLVSIQRAWQERLPLLSPSSEADAGADSNAMIDTSDRAGVPSQVRHALQSFATGRDVQDSCTSTSCVSECRDDEVHAGWMPEMFRIPWPVERLILSDTDHLSFGRRGHETASRTSPFDCAAPYDLSVLLAQDCREHYEFYPHLCGERLRWEAGICPVFVPSLSDVHERSHGYSREDEADGTAGNSHRHLAADLVAAIHRDEEFADHSVESTCPSQTARGTPPMPNNRVGPRLPSMSARRRTTAALQSDQEQQAVCDDAAECRPRQAISGLLRSTNESAAPAKRCSVSRHSTDAQEPANPVAGEGDGQSSEPVFVDDVQGIGDGLIWDISVDSVHNYVYESTISSNCWFDEEILNSLWYPEVSMRLMDFGGRFIWSATPEGATEELWDVHERALEERGKENPAVTEHFVHIRDNPYISEENKRKAHAKITSPDLYRVKVDGEFAASSFHIFPQFSMQVHGCEPFDIPPDWTRYMVVDPSHRLCAVLFAAVPPPNEGDFIYLYDELCLRYCDATKFGEHVAQNTAGQVFWEFIIDSRAGRQTEMGSGLTHMEQYRRALDKRNVRSVNTGSGFVYGMDNPESGNLAVHDWLLVREDGTTKLRVFRNRLPTFEEQIKKYRKTKTKNIITDKPVAKNNDFADCFDAETEVLTQVGWKRFDCLLGTEPLATVNLESDQIEYQIPELLIDKPYSGEMIAFGGKKLNGMVTPNHRMVVYPLAGYRGYEDGDAVIKAAGELSVYDRIKLNAKWGGDSPEVVLVPRVYNCVGLEKEIDPCDFAEFLGWYVAEGCCAKYTKGSGRGYAVHVSQMVGHKRIFLKCLLDRLPWKWQQSPQGFYTSSKQLWHYLKPLGDDCYNKRAPQWVKESNSEIIRRFAIGAILGDGWLQKTTRHYSTTSRRLADDMQELFIKLGRSASLIPVSPKPYCIRGRSGESVEQYWVNEWKSPTGRLANHGGKPNFEAVNYEGRVYCASVPNSTLIVRRNGKPMITGNCLRYLRGRNPQWHKARNSQKSGKKTNWEKFQEWNEKRQQRSMEGSFINLGPGRGVTSRG